MARYIDVDQFKDFFQSSSEDLKNRLDSLECDILEVIEHLFFKSIDNFLVSDNSLAADVRLERHGEWNVERYDGEGIPVSCSCCQYGFRSLYSIWTEKYDYEEYDFYPRCGAKMDGKGGESDEQT